MSLNRPVIALDVRSFGRGRSWLVSEARAPVPPLISADLKLFATTFVAGFLFVSILLS
jgi:hypothetical protein